MNNQPDDIIFLWKQFAERKATKQQIDLLFDYLKDTTYDEESLIFLDQQFAEHKASKGMDEAYLAERLSEILTTADLKSAASSLSESPYSEDKDFSIVPPIHRVHLLRRGFFRYAAAIIVLAGSAGVWYAISNEKQDKGQVLVNDSKRLQTDIAPGGDRAILTLADGSEVLLDSAADGQLANQGGVKVVKLANGQVAYDLRGLSSGEMMWNTMSTPVGGQYQVTLSDGTKVWLNAASSITFPTAFTGDKRSVKVKGEIYFEVAQNKRKPFIVDVGGRSSVEVLGTSFNINSYEDEATIKATLLEGSVKVSKLGSAVVGSSDQQLQSSGTDDKRSAVAILKPGQQAQIDKDISVISNADIEQALAWKNGLFNFNGSDLRAVARQLERWYDIKVRYDGAIPDLKFKGEMNRGVKLSTVLNWFSGLGINTRLEGKTLIVL